MEEDHHLRPRRHHLKLLLSFLFALFLSHYLPASHAHISSVAAAADRPAVYVVHVRKPKRVLHGGAEELAAWHRSFLPSPSLDSGEPRMVFSYRRAASGFAARLTPGEVATMAAKEGFLSALPDERLLPQTTHSPDFLRLRPDAWRAANRGDGVIVGVIDSGINPDHASLDGARLRRAPRKWRGYCEFYCRKTCNRKLLGARNYDAGASAEQPLPYDTDGHGTHVAATAAGRDVKGAGVNGYANGTASGAAPGAHLAVYKAATVSEVLAAVDQAIDDRVDVLVISLAPPQPHVPIFLDGVAIGALAAAREGILVVAAAGNHGPAPGTLRNDAPWVMTVGASTTDRALRASLRLGDGEELPGESLYRDNGDLFDQMTVFYPTVKRKPAAEACSNLRGVKAAGKIVLCHTGGNTSTAEKARAVKDAGGVAMVVMNSERRGYTITEIPNVEIPAVALDYNTSLRLLDYVVRSPRPTAAIAPGRTTFGVGPSPEVAAFSSRGPSAVNGGVLKPDVLAPGVNIVAASPTAKTAFFLASGTSVAAAHLAGVAAIVNKSNPAWTPAMIRSAIMTTSTLHDGAGGPIADETGAAADLFATGAGHVNPLKAPDPGLVYDVGFADYVRFLCGLGYTDVQVSVAAGRSVECAAAGKLDAEQLNYPSISVRLGGGGASPKAVVRTLTNARCASALYRAKVELPQGEVTARVSPRRLLFWRRGQKRRFTVTFAVANATAAKAGGVVAGRLRWSSDMHVVTTPLVVTTV